MVNYWIVAIPEKNWYVIKDSKKWGYTDNLDNTIKRNDILIFYITKSSSEKLGGNFVGAARVIGDWIEENEPLWPDEKTKNKVIYPYRVPIELIREGRVNIHDLLNKLSFIKIKEKWWFYFRNTPCNFRKPIPEKDAKLILESL